MRIGKSIFTVICAAALTRCCSARAATVKPALASRVWRILARSPGKWKFPDFSLHEPVSLYIAVNAAFGLGRVQPVRHFLRAELRQDRKRFAILIRTWGGDIFYCSQGRRTQLCIAFDPKHFHTVLFSRSEGFRIRVARGKGGRLEMGAGLQKTGGARVELSAILPRPGGIQLVGVNTRAGTVDLKNCRGARKGCVWCRLKFQGDVGVGWPSLVGVTSTWRSAQGLFQHSVGIYKIPGGIAEPQLRASVNLANLRRAGFRLRHGGGRDYLKLLLANGGLIPPPPSSAVLAAAARLVALLRHPPLPPNRLGTHARKAAR